MGLVWSDTSSQRRHTRRANARRQSAGRRAPRRLAGLLSVDGLRRVTFRGLAGTYPMRLPVDPRMPSQRRALDALAHVHRAVHADLHIAGRSCPQGELRDP